MSIFKTAQAGEVNAKQLGKEGCRVTLSVEASASLVTKNFQNAADVPTFIASGIELSIRKSTGSPFTKAIV